MPHIQIATGTWVNTDHIVNVQNYDTKPASVDIYWSTNGTMSLIGKKAESFIEQYQRLCVAHPRPEVG